MKTRAIVQFATVTAVLYSADFAAAGETVGPFDIVASPISASMISGSSATPSNAWLNIVDATIDANEALSGSPILDDGIANLTSDAVLELVYASNTALNVTGVDLVLFDARYDAGEYAVSTSFDGFVQELVLASTSFIDTGVVRDYYLDSYGGPFTSTIYGSTIDLASLGVPWGTAVDAIRVRSLNAGHADFIGVGVLEMSAVGTNYCIATINSTGAASNISATGSASIAANDLVLTADNMPDQPGIFVAGPTSAQIPFFNGFLCIDPNGLQRFSNTTPASGGVIAEAVNIATSAPGGLNVVAGSNYFYQRWFRDPLAGGGNASSSDGIEIAYVP